MTLLKWAGRHRLLSIIFIAATGYFVLVPVSGHFYHNFSPESFLVIHSLMEAVSIIIAFMSFGITYHSYRLARHDQNLFLGAVFLCVGMIDVMHALSYAGMPDFITPNTVDKATQLWVTARLIAAAGFFASTFIDRSNSSSLLRPTPLTLLGISVAGLVLFGVVISPGHLPAMFVPGEGITPLKKYLEYGIALALAAAGARYYLAYRKRPEDHLLYFTAAMAVGIFSELFFTLYASPYDIYNLMGHFYKVIAYIFIYKMLFITSIQGPYYRLARTEEVLREYSNNLEEIVKERTKSLQEKNSELLSLNKVKNDFLAMCSHDMKTPLQATLLYSEMLLDEVDGPVNEKQAADLRSLRKNQSYLLDLITNLLDLARKEQGELRLNLEEVDIRRLLGDWSESQGMLASRSGFVFSTDIRPDGDAVAAWPVDGPKLIQVLNNLLSNALKFTPEGGNIRLTVDGGREGGLRFSMFNSGRPMPEEKQKGIFDKYVQSGHNQGEGGKGVGLGLNIARDIVELHGGQIWVEAGDDGNTFCFTLPFIPGGGPTGEM